MMGTSAFDLLSTPIKRILWQMKWTSLRPIQVEAIQQILQGCKDVIIAAHTAGGKTEAAFLPILSVISESPGNSVRAMYVGPLRALINDQFHRLEELCQYADIPVFRWHGDVSNSQKQKLMEKPSGVLLITPESLESLFVNRSSRLSACFRDLSFVVIDELHAFLGNERGRHLRSLLYRLQPFVEKSYRMIGLSATLGDIKKSAHWLRSGDEEQVELIEADESGKTIKYRIYGYLLSPVMDEQAPEANEEFEGFESIAEDLLSACVGQKNLVFANRKRDLEILADQLNGLCRAKGRPQEFLVHHGSLSREIREETEQMMRDKRPMTTLCSSTLELGIDIGSVTAIGQVGAPWSVSSLIQRLGRSGRGEDEPSVMRVYILEHTPASDAHIVEHLFTELLQAVAMTELMLEKWVEPPVFDELDLSTLIQQILSVLAQTGGSTAADLFDVLVMNGGFRQVDKQTFQELLRSMAEHDLIEQMPTGDLILGLGGQRVVERFDFYSAFMTPEEYRVCYDVQLIGTLPTLFIPQPKDHIILAGRRWQVESVDCERKEIQVRPARGRKPPRFNGSGGEIHPRIRQKMKEVLINDKLYPYLSTKGSQILTRSRQTARNKAIWDSPILPLGQRSCIWFTWTGTRAQRTLEVMALAKGIRARDLGVAMEFECSQDEVVQAYQQILDNPPSLLSLAKLLVNKQRRKYDNFLTDELLNRSLAESALDITEATFTINSMLQLLGRSHG